MRARPLLRLLPLLGILLGSGCITASMWDRVDRRGERAAAIALTPVTVALDTALFAGWVWLECAGGGNDCCCWRPPRCR